MSQVFENTTIGSIQMKNRILRSATHEGLSDEKGGPLPELAALYERLVRGGAGAIITGYFGVQANGRTLKNMKMIDHDDFNESYVKINTMAGKLGVPIIAQIAHGGGQINKDVNTNTVVAPSVQKYPLFGRTARELTEPEINEIIKSFVAAIVRAKKAGFAGVQLHAASGYLLSSFLSPSMNRRSDRWGGTTEKRFRIMMEIADRARDSVGKYPLLVKYCAYDFDKNGMKIQEGIRIAELLQKSGYDAMETTCGGSADGMTGVRAAHLPIEAYLNFIPWIKAMSPGKKIIFRLMAPLVIKKHSPIFNYNVNAAAEIKKHVDVPVIVVGGIRRLNDIESIISEKKADYVSMCRPFIIEPDIVNKFKSGAQTESRCINCGYCLISSVVGPVRCYHGKIPKESQ
jgi:2,4-dienoyl-CoA reductase-like NADH-dependent reductase (Old Yellow Enzyme family)